MWTERLFRRSLIQCFGCRDGGLAQLGERLVCIQEVTGSSPVFSTILVK